MLPGLVLLLPCFILFFSTLPNPILAATAATYVIADDRLAFSVQLCIAQTGPNYGCTFSDNNVKALTAFNECFCSQPGYIEATAECLRAQDTQGSDPRRIATILGNDCNSTGTPMSLSVDDFAAAAGGDVSTSAQTGNSLSPTSATSTAKEASTDAPGNSGAQGGGICGLGGSITLTNNSGDIVCGDTSTRKNDGGSSASDRIALGTGLGIGIPSLILAFLALCA